jgi:hypothetical protein
MLLPCCALPCRPPPLALAAAPASQPSQGCWLVVGQSPGGTADLHGTNTTYGVRDLPLKCQPMLWQVERHDKHKSTTGTL